MKLEQVCVPLHDYFSQNPFFRVLLPISMPLMLVCAIIPLVDQFINLGSLVTTIAFLAFFLFVILVVSTCDFRMTAVGLGVFAAQDLLSLIIYVVRYRSLPYATLVYVLIFGFLAVQAYRKSMA